MLQVSLLEPCHSVTLPPLAVPNKIGGTGVHCLTLGFSRVNGIQLWQSRVDTPVDAPLKKGCHLEEYKKCQKMSRKIAHIHGKKCQKMSKSKK